MFDDEGVLLLACINIVGALLNLVVAECDTVEAAEIEDTGVECAEGVVLHYDVLVVAAVLLLADAAVVCDVCVTPCLATIEAVVEYVVAHLYVAYTRLLVPVAAVALEEDRGTGNVEVVVLDDNLAT